LKLVKCSDFERVIIFADSTAQKAFKPPSNVRVVPLGDSLSAQELRDAMVEALGSERFGFDVAVNLASGSGKEHAALISAALRLGAGIRLVGWKDGIVEI
jgi:hypothetical protein